MKSISQMFILALLFLFPLSAYAADKTISDVASPGVDDLNNDSLTIENAGTPQSSQTLQTTLGGASLTVTGSNININGSGSSYDAGLAGYNAPLADGQVLPENATNITDSIITIINGNLTSGLDNLDQKSGGSMNINGSAINLQGADAEDAVLYGFGLPQAAQTINLANDAHVNVTKGQQGTILTNYGTVNVEATSSINVDAGSVLNLTTGSWPSTDKEITETKDSGNISQYNIDGTWTIEENAQVISPNPTQLNINLNKGANLEVGAGGTVNLQTGWNNGAMLTSSGNINLQGDGANVWVGKLTIEDGEITINQPNVGASNNWAHLSGYKGVVINGGNITLNPNSEIQAGSAEGMQISGGSITLAGNGGAGGSGSAQLRFSGKGENVISGGTITVQEGKQGSFGAGTKLSMTGGTITANGALSIAGSNIGSGGIITPDAYAFEMTGGNLDVGGNGALNLINNINMTASGNAVINNNGDINVGDNSAASLTLATGSNLTGGKVNIKSQGALNLGDAQNTASGGAISSNITVNGGKMTVANGAWSLKEGKSIAIGDASAPAASALQIGGAGSPASLDISRGTLKNEAGDAVVTNGTLSSGIGVMADGKLLANFDKLFTKNTDTGDIGLLNTGKFYLDDTGAITIAGVKDSIGAIKNLNDLAAYKTALLTDAGSAGSVNWQDVDINGNPVDGVEAGNVLGNTILASNDISYGDLATTGNTVQTAQSHSIGGKTLVLEGTAAADTTTKLTVGPEGGATGQTLTLLGGDNNPNLLTQTDVGGSPATNIEEVIVNPQSKLALGSDAISQKQGGVLGAPVTLNDGSTLQTAGKGSFATGAITTPAPADGSPVNASLIVSAGSALTAPVAGATGAPIANIDVGEGGQLKVNTNIIGATVTNAGALTAQNMTAENFTQTGGSLDLGSLTLGPATPEDNASVISGGSANINNLALSGGLLVGKTASGPGAAPVLNVNTANLANGRLIINNSASASMPQNSIRTLTSDADFDVRANSMLTVGEAPDNWASQTLAQSGLTAAANGAINSVLAVYSPITLKAGGAIMVDGTAPVTREMPGAYAMLARNGASPLADTVDRAVLTSPEGNRLILGDNAALVVDGPTAATGRGIIIPSAPANGNPRNNAVAEVASGAKIVIADARPHTNYVILGQNANGVGWDTVRPEDPDTPIILPSSQLVTNNPMLPNLTMSRAADGTLTIASGAARSASEIFPGLDSDLVTVMNDAFNAGQIGVEPQYTHAGQRGTQFLSRALVMANNGKADQAARALDSAGRMVAIGAVPQMTLAANQAAGSAVTQRTTLAEPMGNMYTVDANGQRINRAPRDYSTALWIMPLFQSTNGFSMSAGKHDYDFSGTLGGIALGADYTINDATRVGVAFNIGGGYAEGSGTLNKTTNNMNFWGVGAYAGYNQDNFGLMGDVFHTSTYNSLRQNTPEDMDFGKLKADVNGHAISVGLRAEYKIPTQAMDIVPHAGVRYTNLSTDSYKIKREGTVIKGDAMNQDVWQFPIGVTMTRLVELDQGWRFKPLLDLHLTPAAGDFKAKSKIRFTGTDEKARLKTKTMDYITYGGTVGLEFSTDELSLGLSYSGEFGEETSAHGVFGTFRYEF